MKTYFIGMFLVVFATQTVNSEVLIMKGVGVGTIDWWLYTMGINLCVACGLGLMFDSRK